MSFDKKSCQALSKDIEKALDDVAKKHGVTIRYAGGRFGGETFDIKLKAVVLGKTGEVQDEYEAALKRGFPRVVDLEVPYLGGTVKIVGLYSKGKSRRFIYEQNGKKYRFPDDEVVFTAAGGYFAATGRDVRPQLGKVVVENDLNSLREDALAAIAATK